VNIYEYMWICTVKNWKYTYEHYIHTYIHTYRHTYIDTYIRTYIHRNIIYIRTYIHTYIRSMYIHTYVHTYIQTLYAYVRTYLHTYIHTHGPARHIIQWWCTKFHIVQSSWSGTQPAACEQHQLAPSWQPIRQIAARMPAKLTLSMGLCSLANCSGRERTPFWKLSSPTI